MRTPLLTLAVMIAVAVLAPAPSAAAPFPRLERGTMAMAGTHRGGAHIGKGGAWTDGLTRAQIHDLQSALAREGCDPGRIDSRLGPRTRRAIACARKAKGIGGSNANELFRALGLSFTLRDSTGMGGFMRSARPSGMRGDAPQGMKPGDMLGHDSAMVFDSSSAGKGGVRMKERRRGSDTLPPGRTPR